MNEARALRIEEPDTEFDGVAKEFILELDMRLRMVEATTLPPLRWMNHAEDEGVVSDLFELADLIDRVGRSEDWLCLSVRHSIYRQRFAYCCGNMRDLAVEVGIGQHREYAVTPTGARRAPQRNIGGSACEYWCSYNELIPRTEIAPLFGSWLYDLRVDKDFELRRIGPSNGWDRGAAWP